MLLRTLRIYVPYVSYLLTFLIDYDYDFVSLLAYSTDIQIELMLNN